MLRTFRYEEIADELREQIGQGAFDRQKLPSERILMTRYGVHRNTVRNALAVLEGEGRISRSSKRGSFINPAPLAMNACVTGTVLVISHWNDVSTALENLLHGLTQSLSQSPLSLLYFDSRPRQGRSRYELPTNDYLIANDVRGIVLWPQSPADVQALNRLRDFAPLILVDRQIPGFETNSVVFDDFAGSRAITKHLLELGHRRIGFLTDEVFAETVQQRWRGYAQALESHSIMVDPTCNGLFQGIYDPPYAAQMRLLLEGGGQPLTAVVCANDTVALDLMHLLRREGSRVPEEVAITGFGNLLPNSMEALQLTTVLQPFKEAGEAVGKILLAQVNEPNTAVFQHISIPVQLVLRASSGMVRVDETQ